MEYKIDGIIKFSAIEKIKLHERLEFTSPFGARVGLDSTHDNNITTEIFLEAVSENDAIAGAEFEISRICYLLSYFHNIPISSSSIKGIVPVSRNHEGHIVFTGKAMISLDAIVSHVHGLNAQSVNELAHRLEKDYPPDFEDVVSRWKEAISIGEPIFTYFLLYRLIEFLFESDTDKITEWIKSKEPSVRIHHDRRLKRDITHYTYLRHNIHPRNKEFPFEDIRNASPKLQALVKAAIEERFGNMDKYS